MRKKLLIFGVLLLAFWVLLSFVLPVRIAKPKAVVEKTDSRGDITQMIEHVIDSLKNSYLAPIQKQRLYALQERAQSLSLDTPARLRAYDTLAMFWRDSIGAAGSIARHYYMGERALLDNSAKDANFAACFFTELVHITREKELKPVFVALARRYYDGVLCVKKEDDSARIGLALLDIYGGENPMRGVEILKKVIATDTTHVYALRSLGESFFLIGSYEKALVELKKAYALHAADTKTILYIAESSERLKDTASALRYYRLAKKLFTQSSVMQSSLEERISSLAK